MRPSAFLVVLLVRCGGPEFTAQPAEDHLIDPPPPVYDAGMEASTVTPDASAPATDAGLDSPAPIDAPSGTDAAPETDAAPDAPVGYCGPAFACGSGWADPSTSVCVLGNNAGVYGSGPVCNTCARYTCACFLANWPSEFAACVITACDDSGGQVRITCQ